MTLSGLLELYNEVAAATGSFSVKLLFLLLLDLYDKIGNL